MESERSVVLGQLLRLQRPLVEFDFVVATVGVEDGFHFLVELEFLRGREFDDGIDHPHFVAFSFIVILQALDQTPAKFLDLVRLLA